MSSNNPVGRTERLTFSGKGGEYFRIWIVNLALSILTLGIYSAWAKVRRLKYFYQNTRLAGSSFDFHGDPIAILKGRVIAVILLLAYNFSGMISPQAALVTLALLVLVFPWLIVRSLRFKLHNSSYRGLRFSFRGTNSNGYVTFLLFPLLALVTLYLLTPLAHHRIKRFQHANSWYGNSQFAFNAGSGSFFALYGKLLLMAILLIALAAGGAALLQPAAFTAIGAGQSEEAMAQFVSYMLGFIIVVYLLLFVLLGPWFAARMQNLVWNNTTLDRHSFASNVHARGLMWIYLSNFIGILLTVGLYKPFADIRVARYRLEHMAFAPVGDMDAFMADQQQSPTATGEEAADLFDFDISF